jgi:hypothetical protein
MGRGVTEQRRPMRFFLPALSASGCAANARTLFDRHTFASGLVDAPGNSVLALFRPTTGAVRTHWWRKAR